MEDIYTELDALKHILDGSEEPRNLTLPLLRYITKNFSDEQKIAVGGCGEIYKGTLKNGVVVVKRLLNRQTIEEKLFHQEVRSLMGVKHQNIVRFLGYCSNTEQKVVKLSGVLVFAEMRERLLCFEYISNGSLRNHLADELRGHDWPTRYQIICGICAGLHHLHKEKSIIHMDLKPDNILLDDQMVPKITDFGLSRFVGTTHTMSTERLLSLGYCAPEYLLDGRMSVKSDIYSLGVIIIELVTGSKEQPNTTNVLRRWRHRWSKAGKQALLEYKQVTKCIELALNCIDKESLARPFIWDIMDALDQIENVNSSEASFDQITSCLWDMLRIEPLELHFPFEPNKQISCSLVLSNDTDDYFAFNLHTMNPLQYEVQPDKGVTPPRSKCSVTIVLQAQEQVPKSMRCTEEFSVQSTRVGEGLAAMDITKDTFSETTCRTVDKVNLTVVFDMPPSPEDSPEDFEGLGFIRKKSERLVERMFREVVTMEEFLVRTGVLRENHIAMAVAPSARQPNWQPTFDDMAPDDIKVGDGPTRGNIAVVAPDLGEMTLEEFMVRAGIAVENHIDMAPPPPGQHPNWRPATEKMTLDEFRVSAGVARENIVAVGASIGKMSLEEFLLGVGITGGYQYHIAMAALPSGQQSNWATLEVEEIMRDVPDIEGVTRENINAVGTRDEEMSPEEFLVRAGVTRDNTDAVGTRMGDMSLEELAGVAWEIIDAGDTRARGMTVVEFLIRAALENIDAAREMSLEELLVRAGFARENTAPAVVLPRCKEQL